MAVKIRLARHGKKNSPFYSIVVADAHAPRDGKFIERIGSYNPCTNPATIELDADKAFEWLNKGAQPSDTCRRILSYKGVLLRKHLMGGVQKGAFSQEVADAKLEAWLQEKAVKVTSKKNQIAQNLRAEQKSLLEAEAKVNEQRAAALLKKRQEAAAKLAEAAKAAAEAAEAAIAEAEGTATPEAAE